MSAELIIGKELVQWASDPCCGMCASGLAARVVSELRKAGMVITQLPKPDINAELVLTEHRYDRLSITGENTAEPLCRCGWVGDHPAHLIAELRKAGMEIVQLPAKDETNA